MHSMSLWFEFMERYFILFDIITDSYMILLNPRSIKDFLLNLISFKDYLLKDEYFPMLEELSKYFYLQYRDLNSCVSFVLSNFDIYKYSQYLMFCFFWYQLFSIIKWWWKISYLQFCFKYSLIKVNINLSDQWLYIFDINRLSHIKVVPISSP
jgi:hypothetical protein